MKKLFVQLSFASLTLCSGKALFAEQFLCDMSNYELINLVTEKDRQLKEVNQITKELNKEIQKRDQLLTERERALDQLVKAYDQLRTKNNALRSNQQTFFSNGYYRLEGAAATFVGISCLYFIKRFGKRR